MYSLFDEKIFGNDKIIKVLVSGAFLKSLSVYNAVILIIFLVTDHCN